MEQPLITAVTHSIEEARVTLKDVPHSPGIAGRIATALAANEVNIDMIIQNEPVSAGKLADISFTIPRSRLGAAREALAPLEAELGIEASGDEAMGKVSIIGAGMKSHPEVAAKVFTVLGDEGVNIEMIATSPIKISCVIAGDQVPGAVRALHTAFELSGPDTIRPERPFGEFA
jgi:aspartate kinase